MKARPCRSELCALVQVAAVKCVYILTHSAATSSLNKAQRDVADAMAEQQGQRAIEQVREFWKEELCTETPAGTLLSPCI